jgi:hypothetical protein
MFGVHRPVFFAQQHGEILGFPVEQTTSAIPVLLERPGIIDTSINDNDLNPFSPHSHDSLE